MQAAAGRELAGEGGSSRALVAAKPSGDVLAVANRPIDDTFNRAFEGSYPPGPTAKVITTAALPRDEELSHCPRTRVVGGRLFFEGPAGGLVPFTRSFVDSCNTAFVGLSRKVEGRRSRRAPTTSEWDEGLTRVSRPSVGASRS